ncbi:MAG: hypothetical protein Q7J04_06580 [Microcella sp.]|nr:hypothetical protein [Microcella sp.]
MLALALTELLQPLGITVQADVGALAEIDPSSAAAAQLVIVSLEPTAQQGQWLSTWELWLCAPSADPAEAEAQLSELLPAAIQQLELVVWLTVTKVNRDTHPNNHAAWRIDLTTLTTLS